MLEHLIDFKGTLSSNYYRKKKKEEEERKEHFKTGIVAGPKLSNFFFSKVLS